METLPTSSHAALTDGFPMVLGNSPAISDARSPLISDAYRATTPCCGVSLSMAAAVNPAKSDGAGRTTHPLDCLGSLLAKVTLTAYSAIPDKASLFRNAKELTVVLRIFSSCRSTSKKLGMSGAVGNVVTNESSRSTNSAGEPASQAVPSAVQAREASHTLSAPRLPGITHDRSSNLVVEGTRVAVAQSGRGSSGTTAVGASRGADVVTGEAAADPVCRGRPLAADRVLRVDDDTAERSSDNVSSPHFFSLLVR